MRNSSASSGKQRTHNAIATVSSSTGTRINRSGRMSLRIAGARSPRRVVHATTAASASSSTPTSRSRVHWSSAVVLIERPSIRTCGAGPHMTEMTPPSTRTVRTQLGMRGTAPRGIRAASNATTTTAPTIPSVGHDGRSESAKLTPATERILVPAQRRCTTVSPGR